jgi:hypothetical protein
LDYGTDKVDHPQVGFGFEAREINDTGFSQTPTKVPKLSQDFFTTFYDGAVALAFSVPARGGVRFWTALRNRQLYPLVSKKSGFE